MKFERMELESSGRSWKLTVEVGKFSIWKKPLELERSIEIEKIMREITEW